MVRSLKLIFDQDPVIIVDVLAQDVRSERPNALLLGFKLQLHSNSIRKNGEVVWTSQPGGEVSCFTHPYVPQLDPLKTS